MSGASVWVAPPALTKSCSKAGRASSASLPRFSLAVGTSRQPRTRRPSERAIFSIPAFCWRRSLESRGRNASPAAYSPTGGSSKPTTARRNASGICVRMPAPSPVPASEPMAPRCSRLRRASRANAMMSCPASPRRVATMARPQASFSNAGLYMPCFGGYAPEAP